MLVRVGEFTRATGQRFTADEFREELAAIREQGWARSIDERVVGAASIAAPVIRQDGCCTTAVQVAGQSNGAAFQDPVALSVEVRQAAAALAARLG
jgi:DNA-binding IclR family transcriptional regulator